MAKETVEFNSYENPIHSAMWPAPFMYKGEWFKCIEQFYQFRKLSATETELRAKIMKAFDPYKMKFYGSPKAGGKPVKDHDAKRIKVMQIAIRECYMQNPHRLQALLGTGKASLIHTAEWDDFWGTGKNGKGRNQYGILLEIFRNEMKGADVWKVCKAHQIK